MERWIQELADDSLVSYAVAWVLPHPTSNPPKDSPKSIVPWCMGHKKGPHVMQTQDFNEGTG
jgi:hypothetical protein